MGVAKWRIIRHWAKKKSVSTTSGKLDSWFARLQHTHTYIYTDTEPITLPCSLVRAGDKGDRG